MKNYRLVLLANNTQEASEYIYDNFDLDITDVLANNRYRVRARFAPCDHFEIKVVTGENSLRGIIFQGIIDITYYDDISSYRTDRLKQTAYGLLERRKGTNDEEDIYRRWKSLDTRADDYNHEDYREIFG